jgi:hypothetical protein
MAKILIIRSCRECPHFIKAGAGEYSETCHKFHIPVPYNLVTRDYPIPTDCKLEDHKEFEG